MAEVDQAAARIGREHEDERMKPSGPLRDLEDRPAVSTVGLHGKYHGLRRTSDNSEVEGWYFVIRENDEAGKAALLAYADACEGYAPELAADLRQHVRDEQLMDGLYEAGWER